MSGGLFELARERFLGRLFLNKGWREGLFGNRSRSRHQECGHHRAGVFQLEG